MKAKLMKRDTIVDALMARGITYLDGGSGLPIRISDADLIAALAQSEDPRLQLALIPLLLAHPSIAALVPKVVVQTDARHARLLRQLYTAAACLQRYWYERLRELRSDMSLLPDYFGAELNLPSLDQLFGRLALGAVAEQLSSQADGSNWWAAINKTIEDFIRQPAPDRQTV
jgi:hypothetical protein